MPDNTEDIIDSRDIIERIEELEALELAVEEALESCEQEAIDDAYADFGSGEDDELAALRRLADDASGYAADWHHGEQLIRDSHFKEYAQELAEDCGMLENATTWPGNCIDWDQAAKELQQDYTTVDFDGVTYWIR